jgi:hypothetical protein
MQRPTADIPLRSACHRLARLVARRQLIIATNHLFRRTASPMTSTDATAYAPSPKRQAACIFASVAGQSTGPFFTREIVSPRSGQAAEHAPEDPIVCTSFRPPARRAGRLRHHRQILSRRLRPSRIRPHDRATGSPPLRDGDAHLLSSAWREAPQLRASQLFARSQGPHCRFWARAAVFISCKRTYIYSRGQLDICL